VVLELSCDIHSSVEDKILEVVDKKRKRKEYKIWMNKAVKRRGALGEVG